MEGYHAIAEHVTDYAALFYLLQQWEEKAGEYREKYAEIQEREAAGGLFLPALHIKACYGLTETEFLLLMFAAACEADGGLYFSCQQKYGGIQPDFQYALHLISRAEPVDFSLIAALCDCKSYLWELFVPEKESRQSVLRKPVYIRREVLGFLLSGVLYPPGGTALFLGRDREDTMPVHAQEEAVLAGLLKKQQITVLLKGRRGSGKKTLLHRVCQKCGRGLVLIKSELYGKSGNREAEEVKEWQNGLLFLGRVLNPVFAADFSGVVREVRKDFSVMLTKLLTEWPLFFLAEEKEGSAGLQETADITVEISGALRQEEKKLLTDSLIAAEYRFPWQDKMLSRYRFTVGELMKKLREIQLRAELADSTPAEKELWSRVLREEGAGSLLGQVIWPVYRLEDFVGDEACMQQLKKVIRLAEDWHTNMERWQAEGNAGAEGFLLLFHGESGTGKTMSASILAAALDMALFKVDLSGIFDKYIGETEKHLDEIFHVAERGNYVLFFDEAEALFSKRTGITNANDRYSNVSTAYLLQRIEAFPGIVILATNLLNHFDNAFLRRIRYVIRFRNFREAERAVLWRKALCGIPAAEDISFDRLAKMAAFSPARIKAAALTARMLAAGENSSYITWTHIGEAVELEAAKDETVVRKL